MIQLLGLFIPILAVILTFFFGIYLSGAKRWWALFLIPGVAGAIMYVFAGFFAQNGNMLFVIEFLLFGFALPVYYVILIVAALIAYFRNKRKGGELPIEQAPVTAPLPGASGSAGVLNAFLAYSGPFAIILFMKNLHTDPFLRFHIKQGFLCWGVAVGLQLLGIFLGPETGFFTSSLGLFLNLALFSIVIRGITNASQGKVAPVPLIGGLIS